MNGDASFDSSRLSSPKIAASAEILSETSTPVETLLMNDYSEKNAKLKNNVETSHNSTDALVVPGAAPEIHIGSPSEMLPAQKTPEAVIEALTKSPEPMPVEEKREHALQIESSKTTAPVQVVNLEEEPCVPDIVDLVDDDELEIVGASIHPKRISEETLTSVDVADDSEIQVVSSSINHPPQITLPVDPDIALVVDCEDAVTPASSKMDERDVKIGDVSVVAPGLSKQSLSADVCSACRSSVDGSRLLVSRCKHTLCVSCGVRCVAAVDENVLKLPGDLKTDAKESKASPKSFAAKELKSMPMCIVKRCRAPLSPAEAELALAPPEATSFFQTAAGAFYLWRESEQTGYGLDIGPSAIVFPHYTPDMAESALQVRNSVDEEELFLDDFAGSFSPLWLWDKDYQNHAGSFGGWVCAACGIHQVVQAQSTSTQNTLGGNGDLGLVPIGQNVDSRGTNGHPDFFAAAVDDITSNSYSDGAPRILDPPCFPHCAFARSFGVLESINSLKKVMCPEEPTVAKKGTRRDSNSSTERPAYVTRKAAMMNRRKRYQSGSSVQAAKRARHGFAKGTGYAGKAGAEWSGTSIKILEKTARVDAATAFWLARIRCFILRQDDAPADSWPGYMRILLEDSSLMKHLASILITESIMDVDERVPVFVAALRVASALCESPSLRNLVSEPSDGNDGRSVASLIDSLSKQAALLSTGAGSWNLPPKTTLLIKQIRKSIRGVNRHNLLRCLRGANVVDQNYPSATSFAQDSGEKGENKDTLLSKSLQASQDEHGKEDPTVLENARETEKKTYVERMKEHQFATVPGLFTQSSFLKEAQIPVSVSAVGRGNMQRRIASEVASLFSSMPLSWSSTILLRVDEDRYDFLRACVFGPEDTPYDSGGFIFDIFLPPRYPDVPPKFKLLTTGNGKVRFNPNLYDNGKVCLSLLGTWAGPSWTPASTLLQVLVSIQSLILVPDPYFNEPGFERQMGTKGGKQASESYNASIRKYTATYAILENIKRPLEEFRDAFHAHFRLKHRRIIELLEEWFPSVISRQDPALSVDNAIEAQSSSGAHAANLPEKMAVPAAHLPFLGPAATMQPESYCANGVPSDQCETLYNNIKEELRKL